MKDKLIRVLLVEDNPTDFLLLREALAEATVVQFKLTRVDSLSEALRRVSEQGFDVILLDLSLPDSHGFDTLRQMHAQASDVPIVVLTGTDDETLAVKAVQAGAQDYLVKYEVDSRLLVRVVRYAIERKATEKHLAQLARYDSLTGLANRALFMDRLPPALARANRANQMVALMFLDLDRFKTVNDTLGHDVGDLLLQAVAERLKGCLRQMDTVARLGGDEFTLILEGLSHAEDAVTVAEKILQVMAPPFILKNHEVFVSPSIGITIYPHDGDNIEDLMKSADTAMYHAKEGGRNTYQFYTKDMNLHTVDRLTLESDLRRAVEREEFLLHYQPQFSLNTGEVTGVEALIRWHHPERGLVAPSQFIPLAEETGLIIPIGEWVLRAACVQNKAWQAAGFPPVRVAINLSARQFWDKRLFETVAEVLEDTGLNPRYLGLEITEGSAMQDVDYTISASQMLKEIGVQLSVDDFGTGYSSLSYLKRFPIDMLKIDRSFVMDIPADSDDVAITTAIIALAHSLGLKVIAEGVETEDQLQFLRSLQCDEAQGFLFSRPLPAEEVTKLLSQPHHLLTS
ncbi:MAG: EAL domain-containing protein [Candidatus Poribacteria bacterium]|nr:EAL domain-containing protein [Candidatus Poribacteria bacterium]